MQQIGGKMHDYKLRTQHNDCVTVRTVRKRYRDLFLNLGSQVTVKFQSKI
jgi:hypothetical protein